MVRHSDGQSINPGRKRRKSRSHEIASLCPEIGIESATFVLPWRADGPLKNGKTITQETNQLPFSHILGKTNFSSSTNSIGHRPIEGRGERISKME